LIVHSFSVGAPVTLLFTLANVVVIIVVTSFLIPHFSHLNMQVDCANGVGAVSLAAVAPLVAKRLPIIVANAETSAHARLNNG
jgi:hypothetical protein